MENRSFRTALLGGFRKKDVVNFLAEDKRRQEEALQDLNTQLEEAAQAFAKAEGLSEANMQVYNDYEEITVFGKDAQGRQVEATLPFSKLEKWAK